MFNRVRVNLKYWFKVVVLLVELFMNYFLYLFFDSRCTSRKTDRLILLICNLNFPNHGYFVDGKTSSFYSSFTLSTNVIGLISNPIVYSFPISKRFQLPTVSLLKLLHEAVQSVVWLHHERATGDYLLI